MHLQSAGRAYFQVCWDRRHSAVRARYGSILNWAARAPAARCGIYPHTWSVAEEAVTVGYRIDVMSFPDGCRLGYWLPQVFGQSYCGGDKYGLPRDQAARSSGPSFVHVLCLLLVPGIQTSVRPLSPTMTDRCSCRHKERVLAVGRSTIRLSQPDEYHTHAPRVPRNATLPSPAARLRLTPYR